MPGTPASQTVRVGVYDYAPLVFSENGQPRGFFIDMLSDLAQRERWRLVFVPGTWAECLSRLKSGEIDLLPSIAQTPERDTLFRFTEDFLFLDWGVVYKKKGSAIRTVLDLEGKAITALDGSIYTEKLKALLEQFGIKAVIVPKPDYAQALAAVARGEADAGVCPNVLGTILDRKLDITRTDIVFAPIKLRWAVKRGGREDLLPSLDRRLEELKALPGSLYHQSHDKWLGLAAGSALPRWLPWALGIGLLALCALTVFIISLRLLVQRRTEALRESELHFRTLADSGQALIWTSTPDRLCNYFNGPWLAFTGRTLEQELGNGWTEGVHPEDFQRCLDIYVAAFDKRESFNMEYRLRHHSGEYRWIVDQGTPRHDSHGAFLGYIGHCLDVHERKLAEDELLAKTEYLDAMFNNTSTIMLLVNAEGNVVDVNLAAEVMVGQPREALQGHLGGEVLRCVSSFLDGGCGHTEDCPTCPVRTRVMRTFSTGERSFNQEGSLTLAVDGKPVTIHFLISTALIRTRDGDFVLVSLIDITERKLAEEALRQNQEFTRIVMENLPIGLAVNSIDPSVSFEYMNDNFPNIYRTTREKLTLPDGFWEAAYEDPDMRGQMRARVLADCASGDAERMYWADVPITRKGQPTTYVTARNVPLPEHGLVISTVWDVTLRKQGEESLNAIKWLVDRGPGRASAQQAFGCDNLVALNSSRLILDAVGPDILRDIVQDFMTMLGTSSAVYEKNGDYALGLFASNWCRVMDQASRDLCQCDDDAQALASGKWLCHESCWTEASRAAIETGRTADISCHGGLRLYAEPIKAGNETVGAINFGYGTPPRNRQAITELAARYRLDPDELWKLSQEYEHRPDFIIDAAKERLKTSARLIGEIVSRSIVEKDLNLAKDAAEDANRAKSEFLANMSHELRTPMNGVLGMLHLLMLEEELKPAQQSYASNAFEAANRLLSLLNDILDFSRIEAGALVFKQEPYQPSDILDATVGVFSHACARKGLALRMEPEPGLPAWLLGDEARIRQIVFNLVGNAVKFTRHGSITVEAWHRILPGAAPDRLLLAVSDTGVGIPEVRLGSVFDRFSQVDSSYTRQFEGAGLGLAIVRRIVEHLGGSLCIESEAGAGTCVVLSLPAPVGRGAAQAAQADAGAGADAANAEEQVSLRILLAEDEFIGQLGARLMLERMGHSVVAVNDGVDAVAAALKQEFDCVLMDIQMPEMDGLEATRILRNTTLPGQGGHLPIIAMTAYALSGDREKFLAAGMDEYIAKPFQQDELRALLQKVAQRRRGGL